MKQKRLARYRAIYEKNAARYTSTENGVKYLQYANLFFTWLYVLAYGSFWLYALKSTSIPSKDLISVFFAPAFTLILVSAMRLAIDRPRPYSSRGAGITPLVPKKDRDGDSFPSRHLACATAIAMTFLPYFPFIGSFLLMTTFALAYVRFSLGVHYPSDLAVGILVGALCGITVFI